MSRACLQVSRPKFAWKEDSHSLSWRETSPHSTVWRPHRTSVATFIERLKKDSQSQPEGDLPVLHSEESTQNKCGNIESFTALVTIYFIHGSDKASLIWKMTLPEEEKDMLDRIVEKIFW